MVQSRSLIDRTTFEQCEHTIHEALAPRDGVGDVQDTASEGLAVVQRDGWLDVDWVAGAVTEAGYAVCV
ncbi:heavy metal transporter [Microbacterium sp. LRZ72]|uniref:heavy metal transporter n=1 Tax=Microbacterium sp. LRZ72 TaxID=2942481 RepID=UPI0029B2C9BA|nr:heavy metal transporter [Microbacterium sp. LRZ72]MDX2377592.1 heavy metal transporter [Microbacterium sp. LRZ72]